MKKSEREALKKAFNIPDPQNKENFTARYENLFIRNDRRLRFPICMKYVTTAVFAALVIGVWGRLTVSRDYVDKYRNGNITLDTTVAATTTAPQTSAESGEGKNSAVTDASVQTTEISGNVYTQTVTSVSDKSETLENTENSSEEGNNEEEPKVTSAQTAVVNVETTSIKTITSAHNVKTTALINTSPPMVTTNNTINHVTATTVHMDEPTLVVTDPVNVPSPIVTQTTRWDSSVPKPTESTEPINPDPPCEDEEGMKWVIPSVKYKKPASFTYIEELGSSTDAPDFFPSTDSNNSWSISKLFERSKYIISAEAVETIYTDVDGCPYTQYDLFTRNCYKHNGKYPQLLSLYVPGGYIPADVYCEWANIENPLPEGSMVYACGGSSGEIELYEKYIFFINDGSYNMPDGSYSLTAVTDISIFVYDGEKYVSLGNLNLTFTEKDLSDLT